MEASISLNSRYLRSMKRVYSNLNSFKFLSSSFYSTLD